MKEQIEKQAIEEMARDICHLGVSCDECTMLARQMGQSKEQYCKAMQYAKRAYDKCYRKQSEGEWEKRTFIIFDSEKVGFRCSECNTTWDTTTNYCPNCGAHMKGGAE